jgi:uncharacterized membrane protein
MSSENTNGQNNYGNPPLENREADLPRCPNVRNPERVACILGALALLFLGYENRSKRPWLTAWCVAKSTLLLFRGATGYCPLYSALGVEGKGTAGPNIGNHGFLSRDIPGHGGVLVQQSITINRPREELFAFWRDLKNLPQVMSHLESVSEHGTTSHWVAKAPVGTSVEWTAEVVKEVPGELIAWRSLPCARVPNSGMVLFKELPENRGTQVRVTLEYDPPAGRLGAIVAKMFMEEPSIQVADDLRRFKQLMEAGEVSTTEGQPHG